MKLAQIKADLEKEIKILVKKHPKTGNECFTHRCAFCEQINEKKAELKGIQTAEKLLLPTIFAHGADCIKLTKGRLNEEFADWLEKETNMIKTMIGHTRELEKDGHDEILLGAWDDRSSQRVIRFEDKIKELRGQG